MADINIDSTLMSIVSDIGPCTVAEVYQTLKDDYGASISRKRVLNRLKSLANYQMLNSEMVNGYYLVFTTPTPKVTV